MTMESPRFPDRGPLQKDLIITPKTLFQDNHSPQADSNRALFEEIRRKGELMAYYRCSDARIITAGGIVAVSWGSIAGADQPDMNFAAYRGIRASVVLTHFDGDTVKPGEMPSGCGGLKVKEEIGIEEKSCKKDLNGPDKYVAETVKHKDMLIQAWLSAENIATLSGKPTLAAAQDHLTLQIYPIALFLPQTNGEMLIRSKVGTKDTLATSYSAKRIYGNGIPTISESSLPDVFSEMLQQNLKDMQEINSRYPDLRKMQKVQQPRVVFFSTDIRSVRVKYPTLSTAPGTIFKVIVPRGKIEGSVHISDEDLENSLDQLEYPIKHAVKNYNIPNKPFSNTDRLIIETGNLDLSKEVARKALERSCVENWLRLGYGQIIVVGTVGGKTTAAPEYYPAQPETAGS